jgi:hypothetical protein
MERKYKQGGGGCKGRLRLNQYVVFAKLSTHGGGRLRRREIITVRGQSYVLRLTKY